MLTPLLCVAVIKGTRVSIPAVNVPVRALTRCLITVVLCTHVVVIAVLRCKLTLSGLFIARIYGTRIAVRAHLWHVYAPAANLAAAIISTGIMVITVLWNPCTLPCVRVTRVNGTWVIIITLGHLFALALYCGWVADVYRALVSSVRTLLWLVDTVVVIRVSVLWVTGVYCAAVTIIAIHSRIRTLSCSRVALVYCTRVVVITLGFMHTTLLWVAPVYCTRVMVITIGRGMQAPSSIGVTQVLSTWVIVITIYCWCKHTTRIWVAGVVCTHVTIIALQGYVHTGVYVLITGIHCTGIVVIAVLVLVTPAVGDPLVDTLTGIGITGIPGAVYVVVAIPGFYLALARVLVTNSYLTLVLGLFTLHRRKLALARLRIALVCGTRIVVITVDRVVGTLSSSRVTPIIRTGVVVLTVLHLVLTQTC